MPREVLQGARVVPYVQISHLWHDKGTAASARASRGDDRHPSSERAAPGSRRLGSSASRWWGVFPGSQVLGQVRLDTEG